MALFEEAVCFAAKAHEGQRRKGSDLPYLVHPLEVAAICATLTSDPEVLAAAVLHDVVEDAGVAPEELRAKFGDRVAALVADETENKRVDLPPEKTWRLRKEESLDRLKRAKDPGVAVLWLGDKLSNLRSIRRLARTRGRALWSIFHQKDPAQHAWYYRSAAALLSGLKDTAAWQEMNKIITELFPEGN